MKKIIEYFKENIKPILITIMIIIGAIFTGVDFIEDNINKVKDNTIVIDEIVQEQGVISESEIQEIKSEVETIEVPEATIEDEKQLEQEVESEGFELQGDISYESGQDTFSNIQLGTKIGLTYYSQIDNRWKDIMYSSKNDITQTIGSSGCGPTSAAMVVTSIKGIITPTEMSDLYVKNGYRSTDNGTYWSAFRYTADVFNIGYQETANIQKALQLVQNNNYVIVSVGNGLFTTGGHFIVIVGIEGNTLKIYDPYNYVGKFDTSTRRGKVSVNGNYLYCSIDNFKNYANYKGFFAYQNETDPRETFYKTGQRVNCSTRYSQPNSNINEVEHLKPFKSGIISYVQQGSENPYLVDFGDKQAWVNDGDIRNTVITETIKNTVGQTKIFKNATTIYQNNNLTGTKYNYKANTTVTIQRNVDASVDEVKVNLTGRRGYVSNKVYK